MGLHHRTVLAIVVACALVGCGDGGSDSKDAGPPPVDQCTNAGDLAIANALVPIPDGGLPDAGRDDGLVSAEAVDLMTEPIEACGRDACNYHIIYQTPELPACMEDCLAGTAVEGVSPACTNCWVELIRCAIAECVVECLGGDDLACTSCVDASCNGRFYACTGYDAP